MPKTPEQPGDFEDIAKEGGAKESAQTEIHEGEKILSIEVSKVSDFMRTALDARIKYLESIRDGGYDPADTDPRRIREGIIKEVAYANGVSNFISQSMTHMLEKMTGEKFDELEKELSGKHNQLQDLKSEIQMNMDNLVDQIVRRKQR